MAGYWTFNHQNALSGVDGTSEVVDGRTIQHPDPNDPAILSDVEILNALRISRRARDDFRKDFPTLEPDAQDRLTLLLETNPRPSALQLDDQAFLDRVQAHTIRRIPVRTTGPRGGKGYR